MAEEKDYFLCIFAIIAIVAIVCLVAIFNYSLSQANQAARVCAESVFEKTVEYTETEYNKSNVMPPEPDIRGIPLSP